MAQLAILSLVVILIIGPCFSGYPQKAQVSTMNQFQDKGDQAKIVSVKGNVNKFEDVDSDYESGSGSYDSQLETRSTKKTFPNIGYLLKGYNLVLGNPLSYQEFDGGFAGTIFKAKYSDDNLSDDERYKIPLNTSASRKVSCSLKSSASTMKTMTEYVSMLKTKVKVSAGGSAYGVTGSFSASTEYSKTSKTLSSNEKTIIKVEASCILYGASIQKYKPPRLDSNFIAAVKQLQKGKISAKTFLDDFGTHFVTKMDAGARYSLMQEISKSKQEKMEEQGIDVNLAAEASGFGLSASAETSVSVSSSAKEQFEKSVTSKQVSSVGSKPPGDGKMETWLKNVEEDPLPVSYTLKSIVEIFKRKFFKGVKGVKLSKVKSKVSKELKKYCKQMKSDYPGVECEGPSKNCAGGTNCSVNADCKNTTDGYECKCKSGYKGDGEVCRKEMKWTLGGTLSHTDVFGEWGYFRGYQYCKNGVLAKGFLVKFEDYLGHGILKDDTAANGVCLICGTEKGTCSYVGQWGSWQEEKKCDEGCFLAGFRQKVESDQGSGDDTALNAVEYKCRKKSDWSECKTDDMKGGGEKLGDWSRMLECPEGEFICGINSRGEDPDGDDTALNDVIHRCCKPS